MSSLSEKPFRFACVLLMLFCILAPVGARSVNSPRVGVVLSGGGARGIAHVAVLEMLEAHGIPIDLIVGTSMGALIGGLYSAGYSPQDIRTLLATHDLMAMLAYTPYEDQRPTPQAFGHYEDNLFSIGFGADGIGEGTGLIGDQRLMTLLGSILTKVSFIDDFQDLDTPYVAVAVDVATSDRIVLDSGPLVSAIRSSISLPLVFPPYLLEDGRLAMDGGYVDNLPVQLAKDYGADIVIAVDVNASQRKSSVHELNSLSAILSQSMDLVTLINVKKQEGLADILIHPDLEGLNILEFGRYQEILGKSEASIGVYTQELENLARDLEVKGRSLEFKDSTRKGSYFALPDPIISGVEQWEIEPGEVRKPVINHQALAPYWKYVDHAMDADKLALLEQDLNYTKKNGGYLSASFQLHQSDHDANTAKLVILTRTGKKAPSSIGLGVHGYGAFSFGVSTPLSLTVQPVLQADLVMDNALPEGYRLYVGFRGSDVMDLRAGVSYRLKEYYRGHYSNIDTWMSLQVGSIGLYGSRLNPQRLNTLDIRTDFRLGTSLAWEGVANLQTGLLLRLGSLGDIAISGRTIELKEERRNIAQVAGYLSGVYSTQDSSLFPRYGIRLDTQIQGGLLGMSIGPLGQGSNPTSGRFWLARTRFSHAIGVSPSAAVNYMVEAALSQGLPDAYADSYFQYGGYDGIPGYGSYLVRDKVVAGVGFQWHAFSFLRPVYGIVNLRMGLTARNTSGTSVFFMDDAQHRAYDNAPLTQYDLGVLGGLGMPTPLGDIIVGLGINIHGNFSLILEFR